MAQHKLTCEEARNREKQYLMDMVRNGIVELTDPFLEYDAGDLIEDILKELPVGVRGEFFVEAVGEEDVQFEGGYVNVEDGLLLRCHEIHEQIPEGMSAEQYLEEPEEWSVNEDTAVLDVGEGLVMRIDPEALQEELDEYISAAN